MPGTRAAAAGGGVSDGASWSRLRPFGPVLVRRVAVDRVDVIARVPAHALRGVFDVDRRALDAEVGGGARLRRAGPRGPGFGDVLLHLLRLHRRGGLGHDAGPFARQVQQHLALFFVQGRALDPFRLDRLPVPAGAEYEVAHLDAEDG